MQTILGILSTHNKFLTKILLAPGLILEVFYSIKMVELILNINPQKLKKYFYIIVTSTVSIILSMFLPENITIFILMAISFLLMYFIFRPINIKFVVVFLSVWLFLITIELICVIFIRSIFQVNPVSYRHIPIFRTLFQLCVYLLIAFFYIISKKYKNCSKMLLSCSENTKVLLLSNCLLSVIFIIITAIFMIYNTSSTCCILFCLFIILMYFCVNTYMILKSNELEFIKQDLQNSKLYNQTLTSLTDTLRAFKHDYSNVLQALGGYIHPTPNIERIKKIL